jgi:hypothetical protein
VPLLAREAAWPRLVARGILSGVADFGSRLDGVAGHWRWAARETAPARRSPIPNLQQPLLLRVPAQLALACSPRELRECSCHHRRVQARKTTEVRQIGMKGQD